MKRREMPTCTDCGCEVSGRGSRCRKCAGRAVGLLNRRVPRNDCQHCGRECLRPGSRFCSRDCYLTAREVPTGEAHHSWKAKPARNTLHRRAQKMFALQPCEVCGTTEQIVRHHKDENPSNNTRENIAFLCRSHHASLHHGRLVI